MPSSKSSSIALAFVLFILLLAVFHKSSAMAQPRQSHDMFVTVTNGPAPNANAVGASGNVLLLEEFHVVQWEEERKRHAIGGCIPFINRDGAAFAAIKYRRVCLLRERKQPFVTLRIVYRSPGTLFNLKAKREIAIDLWKEQHAVAQQLKAVMSEQNGSGGQFEIHVDANTKLVSVNNNPSGYNLPGGNDNGANDDDGDEKQVMEKHANVDEAAENAAN